MASLAGMLQARGHHVTGSDAAAYPPMSDVLAGLGIVLHQPYAESNLMPRPGWSRPDLVIVGNAISRGNVELEYVLDRRIPFTSMAAVLHDEFLDGRESLVVTGTHGKTTTTSMLAWIYEMASRTSAEFAPSFLIGGVAENFGTSFKVRSGTRPFILEGDEYDTAFFDKSSKFVHYLPEIAIINNLEFDHADIFESVAAIQLAFKRFINLIPRNGQLLANGDDANLAPLLNVTHCPVKRFGLGEANAWRAERITLAPTVTEFEMPSFKFRLNLLGELNVRNALGVIAAARHCGLKNHQIQEAFDTFKGVKRRMEVRGVSGGVTVVDDFGHHPTAIRETLRALRVRFQGQKIWAVFEPRTNTTRRNVFQSELVSAFIDADAVVVAQIARLELLQPAERLDPVRLMKELKDSGKVASYLPDADAIVDHLAKNTEGGDVICVFSNGGFGGIHTKLLDRLNYARRK